MKKELYPDYDWDKIPDGAEFTATIGSIKCSGAISKQGESIYLCQNAIEGYPANNKHGFRYSWNILTGSPYWIRRFRVENLEVFMNIVKPKIDLTYINGNDVLIRKDGITVGCTFAPAKWVEAAYKKMKSLK